MHVGRSSGRMVVSILGFRADTGVELRSGSVQSAPSHTRSQLSNRAASLAHHPWLLRLVLMCSLLPGSL
jgi:hypothetical protein